MRRHFILALLLMFVGARWAGAQQTRSLTLADALRLAEGQSEAVRIAEAGVLRAHGQQLQAISQYFPQLSGSASYTRTLASQFSALSSSAASTPPAGTPPVPPADSTMYYAPCTRYLAPAGATDAERVAGLESFAKCATNSGGGINFSKVGFGSLNQYSLGLSGSFTIFSGSREGTRHSADAARTTADIELIAQRAKLTLDVTQAYFDAALADRLTVIAESSLAQTKSVLEQTRLAREVGNQSEFDLLRAQVTHDNQVPLVLQRRTDRDLAFLRLKQLLNLPGSAALTLATPLGDGQDLLVAGPPELPGLANQTPDTSTMARVAVRQQMEAVAAQEAQLHVTTGEAWPTLTISSGYTRLAFPTNVVPSWSNFLTNWTVVVGASMPLFTGGRLRGDRLIAEANVNLAREQLRQTEKQASLDAQQTVTELAQAEAALRASAGTVDQASKAYSIAEVRFREGLSTEIELNDSRLLLEEASANRAQAVRNLQVARTRMALLRNLPLNAGGAATNVAGTLQTQQTPSSLTQPIPPIQVNQVIQPQR